MSTRFITMIINKIFKIFKINIRAFHIMGAMSGFGGWTLHTMYDVT